MNEILFIKHGICPSNFVSNEKTEWPNNTKLLENDGRVYLINSKDEYQKTLQFKLSGKFDQPEFIYLDPEKTPYVDFTTRTMLVLTLAQGYNASMNIDKIYKISLDTLKIIVLCPGVGGTTSTGSKHYFLSIPKQNVSVIELEFNEEPDLKSIDENYKKIIKEQLLITKQLKELFKTMKKQYKDLEEYKFIKGFYPTCPELENNFTIENLMQLGQFQSAPKDDDHLIAYVQHINDLRSLESQKRECYVKHYITTRGPDLCKSL